MGVGEGVRRAEEIVGGKLGIFRQNLRALDGSCRVVCRAIPFRQRLFHTRAVGALLRPFGARADGSCEATRARGTQTTRNIPNALDHHWPARTRASTHAPGPSSPKERPISAPPKPAWSGPSGPRWSINECRGSSDTTRVRATPTRRTRPASSTPWTSTRP